MSGIGRPKIGSQDPGVEDGNYRRTGIIVNIQALGKKNHNGVAEPVGDINLDHPVGTGPMQEGADGKYINVFFSNYRPGSKPMRKGDWVEFTVIQGKSSQDRPGRDAKPGRVMAGDVRKIGYMSNEERHTDYWKPFFQGTKVDHEGRSVIGQETGTPYYKHPSNPKSMYSRSQYTRSQAGRSRHGGNQSSGDEGRRNRSQERGFASSDDDAQDSPDESAPRQAPGLEVPAWRFDAMREQAGGRAAVEAARRAAAPAAQLPAVGTWISLLPEFAHDYQTMVEGTGDVFQNRGQVVGVDQAQGQVEVRFLFRRREPVVGWVSPQMMA